MVTDGSHFSPPTTTDGVPYVTVRDVVGGKIQFESAARISQSDYMVLQQNGCQPLRGDVLFSKDGTVGRVALVHVDTKFVVLSSLAILRPDNDLVSSEFLALALTSNSFQSAATNSKTGLAIRRVVLKTLKGLSIPVPHHEAQTRIVDLVSSVDAYIDALQTQADVAREARRALLHELLSTGGDDWKEITLGGISNFVSSRLSPEDVEANVPYIGLEHIEPRTPALTRRGLVTDVTSSVTPFEPGDVLFGRLRPYLHKVALADFLGVCSPEVLVLRASASCIDGFLYLLCSNDATVLKCVEMSAGTRMPRTSTSDLASIAVLLPPLVEQERIVKLVSSMDEVIQSSVRAIADAKNLRSGLLSDLLAREHEIPESYDRFLKAA